MFVCQSAYEVGEVHWNLSHMPSIVYQAPQFMMHVFLLVVVQASQAVAHSSQHLRHHRSEGIYVFQQRLHSLSAHLGLEILHDSDKAPRQGSINPALEQFRSEQTDNIEFI